MGTNISEEHNISVALSRTAFCVQTEEKQGRQKWIVIWEGHNTEGD